VQWWSGRQTYDQSAMVDPVEFATCMSPTKSVFELGIAAPRPTEAMDASPQPAGRLYPSRTASAKRAVDVAVVHRHLRGTAWSLPRDITR
jgi:hypothetical protein